MCEDLQLFKGKKFSFVRRHMLDSCCSVGASAGGGGPATGDSATTSIYWMSNSANVPVRLQARKQHSCCDLLKFHCDTYSIRDKLPCLRGVF